MREPAGQTVSRCGRRPRNTLTVFGRNATADYAEVDNFGRRQSTERAERRSCPRIGGAVVFQNAMDGARIEYDDGEEIGVQVTEQSGDDLDRGSADVHYQVFQEDPSASEDAVTAASETAEGTFVYYVSQQPEQSKLEIFNDNTGYSVVAVAVDGALVETSSGDNPRLDQSLQFSNSLLGIQESGTVEPGVTDVSRNYR
jgi:hypothetical protein